ncbi:uncharacterized protein LOC130760984 isoform X2 [Actinidia eriantha]|uniref:uncharacterized protein LOC130760984 isoform X2 n=1 Tax=Actinidia eriantha TaxID=165200 RepID=UPI002590E73A|nr:uncharacterized protein LOC130760984 isoform X2 [Actinidia eriantha]
MLQWLPRQPLPHAILNSKPPTNTPTHPRMAYLRTFRSRHFFTLQKPQNSPKHLITPLHSHSTETHYTLSLISSIFHKPISILSQFEAESISLGNRKEENTKSKKPLHVLFKEAAGLTEKIEDSDDENEVGTGELKKKLRKFEEEVRRLRENSNEREKVKKLRKKSSDDDGFSKSDANSQRLYSLFENNTKGSEKLEGMENLGMEDPMVYKELSPEMVLFVTHLYKKGYFNNANFLPRNKFDVTCFENSYGRAFVKFAAEKFGKDNQEIAKWLSASDLKPVALFGCPSLGRKNIFSAKRLRYFFGIPEETVCCKCVLKPSCKFVNQSVWKGDNKNLNLAVVMRVIILYALESVPPQLVVPDKIKDSVLRLLKEVLKLSQTIA